MATTKNLSFDDGLVTYSFNGRGSVVFNPADTKFVERVYNAFERLDAEQDAYKDKVETVKDKKEIFELAHTIDTEMREIIDSIFEQKVCDVIFPGSVYALTSEGPVWLNLLFALLDEINGSMDGVEARMTEKMKKYTVKYKK